MAYQCRDCGLIIEGTEYSLLNKRGCPRAPNHYHRFRQFDSAADISKKMLEEQKRARRTEERMAEREFYLAHKDEIDEARAQERAEKAERKHFEVFDIMNILLIPQAIFGIWYAMDVIRYGEVRGWYLAPFIILCIVIPLLNKARGKSAITPLWESVALLLFCGMITDLINDSGDGSSLLIAIVAQIVIYLLIILINRSHQV